MPVQQHAIGNKNKQIRHQLVNNPLLDLDCTNPSQVAAVVKTDRATATGSLDRNNLKVVPVAANAPRTNNDGLICDVTSTNILTKRNGNANSNIASAGNITSMQIINNYVTPAKGSGPIHAFVRWTGTFDNTLAHAFSLTITKGDNQDVHTHVRIRFADSIGWLADVVIDLRSGIATLVSDKLTDKFSLQIVQIVKNGAPYIALKFENLDFFRNNVYDIRVILRDEATESLNRVTNDPAIYIGRAQFENVPFCTTPFFDIPAGSPITRAGDAHYIAHKYKPQSEFTIAVKFKIDSPLRVGTNRKLIYDSANEYDQVGLLNNSNCYRAYGSKDTHDPEAMNAHTDIIKGVIVITYSSYPSVGKMYINGLLHDEITSFTGFVKTAVDEEKLYLGCSRVFNSQLGGTIQHIKTFNKSLTDIEIQHITEQMS